MTQATVFGSSLKGRNSGLRDLRAVERHAFGQGKIPAQRIEDMLPRPGRLRVPEANRFPFCEGLIASGMSLFLGPVAATDDITARPRQLPLRTSNRMWR